MEPEKVTSSSRVFSTARMKRRKVKKITYENDELYYAETPFNQNLTSDIENKVHFLHSTKLKTVSENTKPVGRNRSKSLPSDDVTSLQSSKIASPKGSSGTEFNFRSRLGWLEKMSDSTIESNDSHKIKINDSEDFRRVRLERHESERESEKIKILATLLPDELIRDPVSRKPRFCQTALMFPDVSVSKKDSLNKQSWTRGVISSKNNDGFTQLCENYDKTGMGGPSRLTEVLNGYIGSMISIVLSRNGDVCKFGGDAFLCVWKVAGDQDIAEVVHLAIESAIDIQKNCGEHKTDVGVKLRVKIAVAAGKSVFSIIGTKARKHYIIVGGPVLDVRDAEQVAKAGDVIVSPSAWKYVTNYMFYSFTYHSDNKHIKVHDFGPLWKSAQANLKIKKNLMSSAEARPILKYASRLNINDVRPFILPPVMRSIDFFRPLNYLTEMRQVAIVFFNVIADFYAMSAEEIIDLSNKALQVVSESVYKGGGATNKLTLFDKDMSILTVFGLKGFKHELASQVALKCASTSLNELKKLQVMSASAAVTTGMAYCGVIGHALRKEYTVMGHPVNLSARLMCAYQNIVSCDRNTFLHSKLESDHFEVLGYEFMKGIQNSGPYYKFNIRPKKTKLKIDHEAYPLLGRGKEIKLFKNFLKNGMKPYNNVNFMIIFGKARIGKSRLVEKLISDAEKYNRDTSKSDVSIENKVRRLEICVIPLAEDDSKSLSDFFKKANFFYQLAPAVSYSTGRLIFQALLGLGDSSSKEREDKILAKLGEIKDFNLLVSLNPIFNVNFTLTPQYTALSSQDQIEIQKSLVIELYSKCFPKGEKWLIVIEDAEFMDEDSWNLLYWCSGASQRVLYLMTIGQRRALTPAALNCLDHINAKQITLTEIDKWFYSGLACQILGVKAIPVELETLIQSYKSSGNPGWLESYLLSLLQSGSICIGQANSQKMKSLGLVAVPEFMLTRSSLSEIESHGSSQWAECLETFEPITDDNVTMKVCLLGPNFRTGTENETELTMDVMLIKTIDTLKPLQQLVLKAGSVLGNNLKRNALKYIISKDTHFEERQLAKAIKNLFEIKILICGKGNMTQSNLLVPKRMMLATSIQKEVFCECTGLDIPESCQDLPKYANCGYMQFRAPTCRDTIYNLLLDDQKKKFHYYCIEFLRRHTYKCSTCLNVPFENIFGYEIEDQVVLSCTVTPIHGVRSTKLDPKFEPPSLFRRYRSQNRSPKNLYSGVRNNSEPESDLISATDKGDCQCSKILSSVYSVLLEHAFGCGRKDLMLEIQLEYASVSLTCHNVPLMMQILEEALALVNGMKEAKEYPELCTPYIYSKIYTLMGAIKLSMGRLDESLELLKTSLKCLNMSFPRSKIQVKCLIQKEDSFLRFTTELMPHTLIGRAMSKKAPWIDLLSESFVLISQVCMYKQNWLLAKYASLKALNKALESNRNFFGLCSAYTSMIEVAYHYKDLDACAKLELLAINVCKKCGNKINEIYEWEAVSQLYKAIFKTRHTRAQIEEAVLIGFQSVKTASVIRNTNLKLELIPDLIFALIQMNRLSEAMALLQELEFMSQLDSDKSSRLWYYTLCLDFHLYTGFTVVPFETYENFLNEEDDLSLVRDPNAKHRLYTSLWLWCVRNSEWDLSKSYNKALESHGVLDQTDSTSSVFTRLKRLEGLLITLVHKMDQRNIYSINALYTEVHSVMNQLMKKVKKVKLFKPRFNLLRSYYRQIRYRDESHHKILNQAQYQAEKMKDVNIHLWISHLKMVWSNAISPVQRDYWVEHSRRNYLEWHETEKYTRKQNVMYSLPLPKF